MRRSDEPGRQFSSVSNVVMFNKIIPDLHLLPNQDIANAPTSGSHIAVAIKIAGVYSAVGLLWIWISDLIVWFIGEQSFRGFIVSAGKGTLFVSLTTLLVYWLVHRGLQAISRSNILLQAVAEGTTDAVFVKDLQGKYLFFNRAAAGFVGKPVSEVLGKDDTALFDPDIARFVMERDKHVMVAGRAETHEEAITVAGESLVFLATKAPYRDGSGNVMGLIGISRDITESVRDREAVRASEERLRFFVEHVSAPIAMFDRDMRYLHVSRRWLTDYHLVEEDVIGRTHYAIFPDIPQRWKDVHQRCLAGAVESSDEDRFERADGTVQWIRWEVRPWRRNDGEIGGIIIFSEEITARKAIEQALRERERLLRIVTGSAHVGLVIVSKRYEYLFANEAYAEIFGLPSTKIVGLRVPDVLAAGWSQIKPRLDRALSGEHVEYEMTLPALEGAFASRTFSVTYEPKASDLGEPTVVVVVMDITAQKHSELAIRESEARFRNVFERAATGIGITDTDGKFLMCNPAYCAVLGLTEDELCAANLSDLIHPEDREENMRLLRSLSRGEINGYEIENRFLHKTGLPRWVHKAVSSLRDPEGHVTHLIALVTDVTERRRSDQVLRDSEERLRLALEAGAAGTWTLDARIGEASWDDRFHINYGFGSDQPRTFETWLGVIHPEDRARVMERVEKMRHTPGDDRWEIEFRALHPELGIRWHFGLGRCERAAAGGIVRLFGIDLDVTERKRADQELRESEERYRKLVDVLPAAVFINAGGRINFCNPACVRLFGATEPAQILNKSPFELFHPDQHEIIRNRIKDIETLGRDQPGIELKASRLDGRALPVYSVATPIVSEGSPAILIALTDLSERERSTDLLRSVLDSVNDAILTIDEHGTVQSTNPATERLFGFCEREVVGKNVNALMPEPYRGEHNGYIANYLRTGLRKVIGIGRELEGRRRDGSTFPLELTVTEFRLDEQRHFTGVVRDITSRKQLEAQLLQAQKMDAVGRLAGGVAHDFNNLLTVINGYSDIVLETLHSDDPQREFVAAIRDSGDRAARLTQQLLAFSRKAVIEPKILDLNELISESGRLLRRLIGEDIALAVLPHSAPVRIKADPGQLEQVVMNLAVNARDAMPTGGRLTIETRDIVIEENDSRSYLGVQPGRYAMIRVADTGTGMSEEVRNKIFEPFFTTKGIGKGTGLGLAVVHGVVEQCGGHIRVESEVGVGTTFSLLFPLVIESTEEVAISGMRIASRGTETILFVEDEDAVRAIAKLALTMQGFTVLAASCGSEAMRIAEEHLGTIDLLVTDVVMPEMGGRQVAESVRTHRPGIKVLYMSGYTDDAVFRHGVQLTDAFVQKPFTPFGLARKVRAVLDESD